MFNNKTKKEALQHMERARDENVVVDKTLAKDAELLYQRRLGLKEVIDEACVIINKIANKPKKYETKVEKIKLELGRFEELLKVVTASVEDAERNIEGKGSAAAGIALGTGVAAFAPTAAMGIAMTFGTASTGTAISVLSGAAATNAALAWIGGGALVAGGGGMTAGSALLALAGPVGWAIGGAGLLAAGAFSNSKNKKAAEEATKATHEIMTNTLVKKGWIDEINKIMHNVGEIKSSMSVLCDICEDYGTDYLKMSDDQQYRLGTLVNNTTTAVELLNEGIGENK